MKRIVCLLVFLSLQASSKAQNPSYKEKLYYTAKVWGFVKYFHSEVSVCSINWDSVLTAKLPAVKQAVSLNDLNDVLLDMVLAAGPMDIATFPFTDTFSAFLKKNRDFSWFNDPAIRADVRVLLDTIKNNFRPHSICWVQDNTWTTSNTSWLLFPYDNPILPSALFQNFPDETHRLLAFAKLWNILRYFNPYNYVSDKNIDSVLYDYSEPVADAPDATTFYKTMRKMLAHLDDSHVQGGTNSTVYSFPYNRGPGMVLRYIQNQYVVVKSMLSMVQKGDVIVTVDGLTPQQWEDSLRPYISAGNPSNFRMYMSGYMISGPLNSVATVTLLDSLNTPYTLNLPRTQGIFLLSQNYQSNDTLANEFWRTIDCNTGYVNIRNLLLSQVGLMYTALKNKPAIIFDIRGYPQGTVFDIAPLLYPNETVFASDIIADVTYPGSYSWADHALGISNNPDAYQGKVIILMDAMAQSQAEYSCMMLERMANSIKIGSQTAGTDGNVSYLMLAPDMQVMFTSMGVFYPNTDSTQRIGIVPDTNVQPTIAGIRHGRDEVLEKALEIACALSVTGPAALPGISASPNPVTERLRVRCSEIKGTATISLADVSGRIIMDSKAVVKNGIVDEILDLRTLSPGVYVLQLRSASGSGSVKIVKR